MYLSPGTKTEWSGYGMHPGCDGKRHELCTSAFLRSELPLWVTRSKTETDLGASPLSLLVWHSSQGYGIYVRGAGRLRSEPS